MAPGMDVGCVIVEERSGPGTGDRWVRTADGHWHEWQLRYGQPRGTLTQAQYNERVKRSGT